MQSRFLLMAVSLGLAGCGGNARSDESETANTELLDPATVNAILGADIPAEQLEPANAVNETDAADENKAGNEAE